VAAALDSNSSGSDDDSDDSDDGDRSAARAAESESSDCGSNHSDNSEGALLGSDSSESEDDSIAPMPQKAWQSDTVETFRFQHRADIPVNWKVISHATCRCLCFLGSFSPIACVFQIDQQNAGGLLSPTVTFLEWITALQNHCGKQLTLPILLKNPHAPVNVQREILKDAACKAAFFRCVQVSTIRW